jgi:hypothetical protein
MVDQEERCRIVNEKDASYLPATLVISVFSSYIEARSDVKNGTRISYCNQITQCQHVKVYSFNC